MTYTRDLEKALKSALDEIGNLQNMIDWHNQKNIEWQDKYDAETNTLKARVAELEVEGKQVCESTIFEQDYQTWNGDWESAYRCRTGCGVQQKISSDTGHDCGKRIKYVESEGE
jgi:hypothetical protein